ncbi:hypothetical protein L2719_08820 [Shewanella schlegeliana]|uniref:Secreted protein n=1 Tax=Shewanella schlegeliana TaxID=190308 RepID=A0ABS1T180_9GAMM|nr:hypothetical protein [Shewanella schlegeliana]MBL4914542.1 hypothetical protein [Shewanella schlegeliana]MCL1109642.1 hypothetical protein [Shewanella schlegeliana]GIU30056.1 hypothetical protein TUM4433_20080 [Shewanella schlegeliana]
MRKTTTRVALLSAGLLLSTTSLAAMSPITECNDCSNQAALSAATAEKSDSVYVVDFVNRTAQKFVTDGKGSALLTKLSVGELNHLNQEFNHRKVYLRAVKP